MQRSSWIRDVVFDTLLAQVLKNGNTFFCYFAVKFVALRPIPKAFIVYGLTEVYRDDSG